MYLLTSVACAKSNALLWNALCHIQSNALNTATTQATAHYFGTTPFYKSRPTLHHCVISVIDKSFPVIHQRIWLQLYQKRTDPSVRSLAGIVDSNPAGGGHGCLSVLCVLRISATGRSLVQMSPTYCGVSECLRKATTRRRPRLNDPVDTWTKYTTNVAWISPKDSKVTERSEKFHGSHNVGCLIKCLVSAERKRKRKNGWKNEGMKENCHLVWLTSYTSASFHNSVVIMQHYLTKNTLKLLSWKRLKSKQKEMSNLYGLCSWQERVLCLKLLMMLD